MAVYAPHFVQNQNTTNETKITDESHIDWADCQDDADDDAMSADTAYGDCVQSSEEDGSQGEPGLVDNVPSWMTDEVWDDRAIHEVQDPSATAMCPAFVMVPVVIGVPAPGIALDCSQQAEEHSLVQNNTEKVSESQAVEGRTTVMIRNIPNNVIRDELLERLASHGFQFSFDFAYLPMDFKRDANLGYAFVNVTSPEEADRFYDSFNGFNDWGCASNKVAEVCWGSMHGLPAHIERFRNSPVMHKDVPDEHKPVLFCQGQRVDFPSPTKRIRAPRMGKA
jgi:hypothetical protein